MTLKFCVSEWSSISQIIDHIIHFLCRWKDGQSGHLTVGVLNPISIIKWMITHHYNDIIMGAIASQITSLTIVYSTIYSDADQRKHQSSASLAFVWVPGEFPAKMASNAENVAIWWRHHDIEIVMLRWWWILWGVLPSTNYSSEVGMIVVIYLFTELK